MDFEQRISLKQAIDRERRKQLMVFRAEARVARKLGSKWKEMTPKERENAKNNRWYHKNQERIWAEQGLCELTDWQLLCDTCGKVTHKSNSKGRRHHDGCPNLDRTRGDSAAVYRNRDRRNPRPLDVPHGADLYWLEDRDRPQDI